METIPLSTASVACLAFTLDLALTKVLVYGKQPLSDPVDSEMSPR